MHFSIHCNHDVTSTLLVSPHQLAFVRVVSQMRGTMGDEDKREGAQVSGSPQLCDYAC